MIDRIEASEINHRTKATQPIAARTARLAKTPPKKFSSIDFPFSRDRCFRTPEGVPDTALP